MPVKKMPGPKGGYRATYGGVTRNFKTRNSAEKWAEKYKMGQKVKKHTKTLKKISNLWNKTPTRSGRSRRAY